MKTFALVLLWGVLSFWPAGYSIGREMNPARNLAGNHYATIARTNPIISKKPKPISTIKFATLLSDTTNLYWRGQLDGRSYYNQKGPFAVGFLSGFFAWFTYGITAIGAVAISATPPKALANHLNPNNGLLTTDPDYYDGYQNGAKKRKAGKTWIGFGAGAATGLGVIVVLALLLYASY